MSEPNPSNDTLHLLEQELLEVEWLGGPAEDDPLAQELFEVEWIGSAPFRGEARLSL